MAFSMFFAQHARPLFFNHALLTEPGRRFTALGADDFRSQIARHQRDGMRSGRFAFPRPYQLNLRHRLGSEVVNVSKFNARFEDRANSLTLGYLFATPATDREPAHMTAAFQPDGA